MRRRADVMMDQDSDETVCLGHDAGTSENRKARISVHTVPALVSFGLVAVLLGLYGLVYTVDVDLPTPLNVVDEKTHPDAFITERARHDLKLMTDLGPRIAGGYENEVLTVNLLKREIGVIMQSAHKNQKLELDFQVVTGSHYLNMTPFGKIVAYSNLQNVIVKLHAKNATQTVLVNAHFDSVPTSPGGSDDGINCAVMLEVLRKLSRQPERPLNNIVFLFNGAEETGLQASHGFITQHRWARDCKVVLNLEAAGAGGKIILFQSGPEAPWLMKYYNNVPHPYAQAAGEEIFQSNVVPSDTDFRIFRDYGGLVGRCLKNCGQFTIITLSTPTSSPNLKKHLMRRLDNFMINVTGLDMAFFKSGYRYHTKYDDFEHIPLGSFQQVGDNTLSFVKDLGNAPEVANPKENPGKVVFFDFLGLFMITYSQTVAQVINYIVALLSLALFVLSLYSFKLGLTKPTLKYLALTFGAIIGGWIIAAVFVIVIAVIIDKIGYSMSWYRNPWLIFGLYAAPSVALSSVLLPLVNNKNITYNIKSQIQVHCVRVIWTVVLLIGTIFNIRSMYALLIPILFNIGGFILIYVFGAAHTIRRWQVSLVISLVIPTVFLMYTSLITLSLFVPITGRIGSDKNAELIIGMLSFFFTILITSSFVALVSLVRNIKFLIIFLGAVFAVNFIIIFTPLGFPYTGNADSPAAERYWILHTRRVFHNEEGVEIKRDSGYFLLNMDRNSPNKVKSYVKDLERAKSLKDDCKTYLLCGLPLVHSKMIQIIEHSTWVPAGQPLIPEPTKLEVLSKIQVSPTVLRYNISITGPDRIGLYFSPKKGVKVLDISLIDKMPSKDTTAVWNGRDLYFILHIWGKAAAPLTFTFDVEAAANSSGVTTEIAVSGIYVHENVNQKVPHYLKFINDFPDWADVTAWLGTYDSWWI